MPSSPFASPSLASGDSSLLAPLAAHDETLADIAHGLKTPLAALQAHLSLTHKKHPRDRNLKACVALANDVSLLLKDLTRLARAESTVHTSVHEKIDAGSLLSSIIEYMRVLAESKGIELISSLESGIIIPGATKQLEEVFMNLMENSIKYIDTKRPGPHHITVRMECTASMCMVSVEDNGIGVDADELPHIFTRSYRTRAGKATAPGSGLGLAIAKKTIEAHGGTISIESAPEKGTCVTCSLPLLEPRLPFSNNPIRPQVQTMVPPKENIVHHRYSIPPQIMVLRDGNRSLGKKLVRACGRWMRRK